MRPGRTGSRVSATSRCSVRFRSGSQRSSPASTRRKEFALAGGAALIARGDVQRQTRDLDFFGLSGDAVDRLAPAVRRALSAAGFTVGHVQVNPGFVRLIVSDGDERTELDLASDARLFPAEAGRLAPTLTGEELAVDKVLAVFGRAEARDFADLMALEPRYGLDRLCELAAEKDLGFDLAVFAEMLGRLDRLRRDEFELDDAEYEQLAQRGAALARAGARARIWSQVRLASSARITAPRLSSRWTGRSRRRFCAGRALRSGPGERTVSDYHINVFYSDEDGGYIADIPDLEACSAFGASPRKRSRRSRRRRPPGSRRPARPASRSRNLATGPRSTRGSALNAATGAPMRWLAGPTTARQRARRSRARASSTSTCV